MVNAFNKNSNWRIMSWETCWYDSIVDISWILLTRFTSNIFLYFMYQWNMKLYVSR